MRPTELYADGGVIQINPSPLGGTWAWVQVDEHGQQLRSASGIVTPPEVGLPLITNNLTEFLALVSGLESLPDGWSGTVYSDSQVTLGRLFGGWRMTGIPWSLIERGSAAMRRLDLPNVRHVLLDGHPTRAQLKAGTGKRGHPCSIWNVHCDELCQGAARQFLAAHSKELVPA